MSLKNSGPERSFSSHDMSQTLWEIPRAQPTTELTSGLLYLSRFDAATPFFLPPTYPHQTFVLTVSLFSPSLRYFPLLYLSWGDVALTSFLKEPEPLRQRWRRLVCFRQEPAHTLIQTHNAHSFCFKHVNCFPSVLGTHTALEIFLSFVKKFSWV